MAGEPADPTDSAQWRPLHLLIARMGDDLARVYQEAEIPGMKVSYVMEILRLHARGPMTITELAESVGRTHSAISQKVSAMRRAGLIRTVAGADARSKRVVLTAKAKRAVDALAAEWRATEATIAELEAEIPYPLSKVVDDIEAALERTSFYDRIRQKLDNDPAWP